ncbi:type II secretion system F family protein [Patescibacteria group bacterium]|nr:type II secretion system F family protein [Patescibacteria group bacterium]MBU1015505.1 type II secretion system F family protein [Patescibacteria group bacterium]MBU1685428.1 type II secretion system F family protein [Patescibacteria group bacterium]MBU1938389.1 type II secretion system F family protein [Patescibacteria group bacterium]
MASPSLHIGVQTGKTGIPEIPKQKPVTKVSGAGWSEVLNDLLSQFQSIKITDKVTFFRLLATMINAGISIVKALNILMDQTENRHMKSIVRNIVEKIETGNSFSQALATYPKYFTEAQIGMVEAGEASGRLNQTLLQIADETEKQAAFRSRIKGAMIYPIVIIAIMVAAFIAVMVLVMPKIKEMFEGLGGELPAVTQSLIGMSDWFVSEWIGIPNYIWLVVMVAAFIVLFMKWKKTKWGNYVWMKFVFALPLFGKLSKKASLAHFCRGLSTMVASGIPIIKALRITAASVGNLIYQRRINQIADDVRHGITMAENMKDDEYYFPNMVVGMIGVAEQTAQIDSISQKLADYYEEEVDNIVKGLSSLMEPLIMVILGAGVAFLVIAVMEPILSASDLAV